MIKLYKSDVGQFVLVHPPSQTFIIDENLEAAYQRLEEHVEKHHPGLAGSVVEASDQAPPARDRSRLPILCLFVFLGLLPFLWLLVMQHNLSRLLPELRGGAVEPQQAAGAVPEELRGQLDGLYVEQDRLRQSVYTLQQEIEGLKAALEEARAPEQAPAAPATEPAPEEAETPVEATPEAAPAPPVEAP